MRSIVLTGGGTGGHVYPSLALLPKLKKHFDRIVFIGGDGIEKEIVENAGLPFYSIKTVKFDRSLSLNNFKIPFVLLSAIKDAKKLLLQIQPDVVFSKGGYASLPTVLAALQLKIPTIAHESDFTLGLANKVAAAFGATIATAQEETAKHKNYVYTGMPLREELFSVSQNDAKKRLGCYDKPVFLALGGSSGAVFLNDTIYKTLPYLQDKFFVIHISGKNGDFSKSQKNYIQIPYTNQIEVYYAAADFVLSRAGATAIAELSALNKRAIIVPLPKGTSRGDQLLNAESARNLGAKVIFQHDLTPEVLFDALQTLSLSPPMRSQDKSANEKIVRLILEKSKPFLKKEKPRLSYGVPH